MKKSWAFIFASVFALISIALIFYSQIQGIDLSDDGAYYLMIAKSLSQGLGFSLKNGAAATTFPPLYPMLLASAYLTSYPHVVIQLIHGLLFFGSGLLFFRLLRIFSSISFSIVATALFCFNPLTIQQYASIHSESLFSFLMLGAILLIADDKNELSPRKMALLGLLLALSFLTRFAGIALIIGVLFALFLHNKQISKRSLLLTAAIALLPNFVWSIYLWARTGEIMGRHFNFYLHHSWHESLLANIASFFFPSLGTLGALVLFQILLLLLLSIMIRKRNNFHNRFELIIISSSLSYALMIVVGHYFADPGISFNQRLCYPLYLFFYLFCCWQLTKFPRSNSFIAVTVLYSLYILGESSGYMFKAMTLGHESNPISYRNSPIMKFLKKRHQEAPDQTYVSTDRVPVVFFNTEIQHQLNRLPRLWKNHPLMLEDSRDKIDSLMQKKRRGKDVFIHLSNYGSFYYSFEDLAKKLKLELVMRDQSSSLYRLVD